MNNDIAIRGLCAAVFSLAFAYAVYSRGEHDAGEDGINDSRLRYPSFVSGAFLPLFLLALTALGLIVHGVVPTAQMILSLCFSIFPYLCLYYIALMLLLPFLRRHINARACAMLWLVPNYLYITTQSYMELTAPLLVIRAPGRWVWALFGVWLAGFVCVLVWKTAAHLVFRRQILADSRPVSDGAVLELWRQEIENAKIKKPTFQLVVSPKVSSPLTVGLFRRRMRVILPERPYSPEELRLIFRHELIHISREDSTTKFFLMFCTAMCWFNPLMWIAMGKSADDMELSCDETVLLGADERTRRQYADLLLSTAGDGRGFTTCLSAAASSMRYRLKSVVAPRKRHSGALAVGLAFFVLCMTCGHVALAYGGGSGRDVLFQGQGASRFELGSVSLEKSPQDGGRTYDDCTSRADREALFEYLSGLELVYLTGNYSFSQDDKTLNCIYDVPEGRIVIQITDHTLKYTELYGDPATVQYYLPQGADWDYLSSILTSSLVQ